MDLERFDPVHIAGIQTRATDILHGTFRTEMKLEGYNGGSCASFFWYHDNTEELDIEAVTPGSSVVNGTINYTTQPSTHADWSPIPGATLSVPLEHTLDTFRTHRFDCNAVTGVKYFLDDKLMHTNAHNVPRDGGSLQLKLWADGNKWWSGMPSRTDTFLRVKSIIAYYNTTSSIVNEEWHNKCARQKKQCTAVLSTKEQQGQKPVSCLSQLCRSGTKSTTSYVDFPDPTFHPTDAASPPLTIPTGSSPTAAHSSARRLVNIGDVVLLLGISIAVLTLSINLT